MNFSGFRVKNNGSEHLCFKRNVDESFSSINKRSEKMKTKRSKRTEIWVTLVLILMGLSCIAYSSWSWVGASAYCWQYADGWGTSSASVSWGGMSSGNWSTYASLDGSSNTSSGGVDDPGGGGSSYMSGTASTGAAGSSISGTGFDGQTHSDSNSDSF